MRGVPSRQGGPIQRTRMRGGRSGGVSSDPGAGRLSSAGLYRRGRLGRGIRLRIKRVRSCDRRTAPLPRLTESRPCRRLGPLSRGPRMPIRRRSRDRSVPARQRVEPSGAIGVWERAQYSTLILRRPRKRRSEGRGREQAQDVRRPIGPDFPASSTDDPARRAVGSADVDAARARCAVRCSRADVAHRSGARLRRTSARGARSASEVSVGDARPDDASKNRARSAGRELRRRTPIRSISMRRRRCRS